MTAEPDLLPLPDVKLDGFTTHDMADYARANVAHATAAKDAEVEALRAKTAVTMGVGTGDGNLFVHGDYESIKAAQEIVLERDALRPEVGRLQTKAAGAVDAARGYQRELAVEYARAERLAEALDELADEWEDNGWPDPASALRSAIAALNPTAAQENGACRHINTVRGEDGMRWCQHCRQQLGQENDDAARTS